MNISSHVFESYTISAKLLILNFKNVNKKLLKFSSKRILYSAMMASALLAGSPWTAFADTDNILEVLQVPYEVKLSMLAVNPLSVPVLW